jgi:hypothetical protein
MCILAEGGAPAYGYWYRKVANFMNKSINFRKQRELTNHGEYSTVERESALKLEGDALITAPAFSGEVWK